MVIAIRADGGSKIGMGHIMRTLVLSKELSKNNDVFYVCRVDKSLTDKYKTGIEKIKSEGFYVKEIRENFILYDMKNITADLLITDSYAVNELYFDETKKMFNYTAYIDDMNLFYYNVDFLINQNINALDFKYKANDATRLLLGSKYVMLRDEFRNVPHKNIKEKPENIMITVGGSDPNHITEHILNCIKPLKYNFHVIVGPSFEKDNNLKKFSGENIKLYYNGDMLKIMQKCDIAISASGSTLYELAACGVPTLGLIAADNQQGIAEKMDELGILINMGWYNKLPREVLINNITSFCDNFTLRKEISERAKCKIDGKGANRIVESLKAARR